MINAEFIFETLITAFALSAFVSCSNYRLRKKMDRTLGNECKEKMRYFLRHPLLAFLFNLGIFLVITFSLKWLNHVLFGEPLIHFSRK